jgi:nucleotidyltransferase/DNA polymerase involved in DNA repair
VRSSKKSELEGETGHNGIVSAMTYEAKAIGIKRGMILSEVRKICPHAIILPSDYETYSIFSKRMYTIVRRYTDFVEEYSIDECFAELEKDANSSAVEIKRSLERELGMTFSIGLSATKVLAKIGSKWKKPDGLTIIALKDAHLYLDKTPVEKIWGIGPATASLLNKHNVRTALQFSTRNEAWVHTILAKPYMEIWKELNGEVANELDVDGRQTYKSIAKTKTFTPPSTDPAFVYSQLSKNVENACIKLRRWNLEAGSAHIFLKTQSFEYHDIKFSLLNPTSAPQDILSVISKTFFKIYQSGVRYRATGISLTNLTGDQSPKQLDLFGNYSSENAIKTICESMDALSTRYGKHAVFLGSSFMAMTHKSPMGGRREPTKRSVSPFKGETSRKRLNVPMIGEV